MELASQIIPSGNSNVIHIPQNFMQALSLSPNDFITLEVRGNEEIIIRKRKANYPSIAELFAGYKGDAKAQELQAGNRIGRELI